MSEPIKTKELSREELEYAFERIGRDYSKETAENAELKKAIKQLRNEIDRLEIRIRELKQNSWK